MGKIMYISIPCNYAEETLKVKSLGINGKGWPQEEAYFNAIKAVPELYSDLCTAVVTDKEILVPYSKKVYDKLLEVEPLPEDKVKAAKKENSLLKATSEEVLKFGYKE